MRALPKNENRPGYPRSNAVPAPAWRSSEVPPKGVLGFSSDARFRCARGEGFQASFAANYVGNRYLDMQNTLNVGSYITVDSTIGYAFRGYLISINGYNLGNRRDPVLQSELGERQFYLLPGRRLFVRLSVSL
jgi:hypothetical protein